MFGIEGDVAAPELSAAEIGREPPRIGPHPAGP